MQKLLTDRYPSHIEIEKISMAEPTLIYGTRDAMEHGLFTGQFREDSNSKKKQYGKKRKNIAEGCHQSIRNPVQSQIDCRPEKRRRIRAYSSG